jgi:hypothetical protein
MTKKITAPRVPGLRPTLTGLKVLKQAAGKVTAIRKI